MSQAPETAAGLVERWSAFFVSKHKGYVSFSDASPSSTPSIPSPASPSGSTVPFCLTLLDACNVPVPPSLYASSSVSTDGLPTRVEHRFNVTFYDLFSSKFFGRTYSSPRFPGNTQQHSASSNTVQHDSVVYKHPLYFHSSLRGTDSVVAVVELVATLMTDQGPLETVELAEASVAWGVLCPFACDNPGAKLRDVGDGEAARIMGASEQLYVGSPRCLPGLKLEAPNVSSLKKRLAVVQGARFAYTLHTNKALRAATCFFRENEIVDESWVIPGLARVPVDDEAVSEVTARGGMPSINPYVPSKLLATPLDNPVYCDTVAVFIGDVRVRAPRGLLEDVLEQLQRVRLHEYGIDPPDDERVSVIQKVVTFGVHNGRTFVRPPHRGVLEEKDGFLVHDTSLAFSGVVGHPLFALLFQLEFVVRLPLNSLSQRLFSHPGSVDRVVAIGWSAFVPFDGQRFQEGDVALTLQPGPGRSPFEDSLLFRSSVVNANNPLELSFNIHVPDASPSALPVRTDMMPEADRTLEPLSTSALIPKQPTVIPSSGPDLLPVTANDFTSDRASYPRLPAHPSQQARSPLKDRENWAKAVLGSRSERFPDVNGTEIDAIDSLPEVSSDSEAPPTEVTLLFMGYHRANESGIRDPRALSFVLKFWKYPAIVTRGAALLDNGANEVKVLGSPASASGMLGVRLSFRGSGPGFSKYLRERWLQVSVWDADSQFLLGDFFVDLRCCLCSGNSSAQQYTESYEVVGFERSGHTFTQGGAAVRSVMRPCLWGHVVMRVVASPLHSVQSALSYEDGATATSARVLEAAVSAAARGAERVDAARLVSKHPDLRKQLEGVREGVPAAETRDDAARKRQRMRQVRERLTSSGNSPASVAVTEEAMRLREQQLRVVQVFREQRKLEEVASKLREYATTRHVLHPSLGSTAFFEYLFKNPYPDSHTFRVRLPEESGLSLVRTPEELSALRAAFHVADDDSGTLLLGPDDTFTLESRESRRIPLRFRSFIPMSSREQLQGDPGSCEILGTWPRYSTVCRQTEEGGEGAGKKSVTMTVTNQRGAMVSQLVVDVEPQPHVVDQTFWFFAAEHDFFKQAIQLPGSVGRRRFHVRSCSGSKLRRGSSAVACGTEEDELYFKIKCGPVGEIESLVFLLYSDALMTSLELVWQVFVCPLRRHDITGPAGQATHFSLLLSADECAARGGAPVLCKSSDPAVVSFSESELVLAAGGPSELKSHFEPLKPGRREVITHVIDSTKWEVVAGWLIFITSTPPHVSRTFQVDLSSGAPLSKRVSYTNPFTCSKQFRLKTSEPLLVSFKEDILPLGPSEAKKIGLVFQPPDRSPASSVTALVFINDQDGDKTIDCLAINLVF